MGGLGFNGLGWIWAMHTLLNGPKWVIGFLRIQPIYYPPKPTYLTPLLFTIFPMGLYLEAIHFVKRSFVVTTYLASDYFLSFFNVLHHRTTTSTTSMVSPF